MSIDDEPLINILRAFESKEEAEDYVRNTCMEEDVVTRCFACRLYEWIHPSLTHTRKFFDTVKTSYAYSELEEIHRGKAEERKKIRKILEANGKTPETVFKEIGDKESVLKI